MDRVNGADTVDIGGGRRGFRSQNAGAGIAGTEVTALYLNALQEEILTVLQGAGIAPDEDDWTQLWQAIRSMIVNRSRTVLGLTRVPWLAVASIQASAPPGAPVVGDLYLVSPAAVATGAWAGHEAELAEYVGVEAGGWIFQSAQNGTVVYANDQEIPYIKDDGAWRQFFATEGQYGFLILADGAQTDALVAGDRPVSPLNLGRVIKPLRGPQGLATADNWGDAANVKPGFAPRLLTGLGANAPAQIGDGSTYYVENVQDQGQPAAFARFAIPASVASGKPLLFSTRDNAGVQSPWIALTDERALQASVDASAARSSLFPHVNRIDGLFDLSTGPSTVTLLPTVTFNHRGLIPYSLQDYLDHHGAAALTWTGIAAGTYHLRWYPPGGGQNGVEAPAGDWPHGRWMLRNVADGTYNPGGLGEANVNLDGTHDKLFAARVDVDGSGNVTVVRLQNRSSYSLAGQTTVPVTDPGGNGAFVGSAYIQHNLPMAPYVVASLLRRDFNGASPGTDLNTIFSILEITRYRFRINIDRMDRLTSSPTFSYGYWK